MEKKELIALVSKFISRRILAVGAVLYAALQGVDLSLMICLSLVVAVYIYCVTFGPNKENGTLSNATSTVRPALLLIALLLGGAFFTPSVEADVLPFVDKLDLQVGPGIEIVDTDPFTIDEVFLTTAKVYERYKIELRIGGLLSDSRRALIFNVARNLSDLIVRNDAGEDKSLLPTVGIWFAGDIVKNAEDKYEVDFIFGLNAVLAEY